MQNNNSWELMCILIYIIAVFAIIFLIPRKDIQGLSIFSGISTAGVFVLSLMLYERFNQTKPGLQFQCSVPLIPEYDINFSLGIDGIGLCNLLLVSYIIPLCIFPLRHRVPNYKQFVLLILLTEIFLILAFISTNIFCFFVSFETILVPMFLIIGHWGGRERKVKAAFYFFFYTLIGSFFMLFGLLYIYLIEGTFDYTTLVHTIFSREDQNLLFWCFFIPFAVKTPMFPFHLWLPEAHVESHIAGSMILAGLLLKLGGFGFVHYTVALFPAGCAQNLYIVYAWAITSIIYASLTALRQTDLKKIIAYSSIGHMNLVVLGTFSFCHEGLTGAIYLQMAHGFVSVALFYCVDVLYSKHHTRSLRYYSGLVQVMPLFCLFFFIFTCANMAFPGTANFVGEILIFSGLFMKSAPLMILASSSLVLSAIYSIWLYNRMASGTLKTETDNVSVYADLNREDLIVLLLLAIPMLIFGLHSELITNLTDVTINEILELAKAKK